MQKIIIGRIIYEIIHDYFLSFLSHLDNFRQFLGSISPDLDAEETDCQNMVQNLVLMCVSNFFLASTDIFPFCFIFFSLIYVGCIENNH